MPRSPTSTLPRGPVGATAISFSRPGSPFITLAVPRQANGAALTELARLMERQPGIQFASAGRQVELLEVPATNGIAAELRELDHLLATRFPAAWNVRHQMLTPDGNCVSKVTVIYPDFFFGKPAGFDEQMEGSVTADPKTAEPPNVEMSQPHGYNTVATLAAKFDALMSTGANPFPRCLKIKLLDGNGHGLVELIDKTVQAVQQEAGRVLVSSAVGYKNSFICGPSGSDECTEADIALAADSIRTHIRDHFVHGILWASFAMRPDVVDRMLVVQAAGNDASDTIGHLYPGLRSARLGSPFAIATVLGSLDDVLADVSLWRPVTAAPELPDLSLDALTIFWLKSNRDLLVSSPVTGRNLILVGSATNAPLAADVVRHDLSNDGAALFAVGNDVSTIDFGVRQGTSYAAPQIAGLASYLWLLEPTLMNRPLQDTIRALQSNAQSNAALTGIVDAYATVLSLDQPVAPTPATARMRLAVLDVNGDGKFDLEDLRRFHGTYIDSGLTLDPAKPDYSRFDLNGDGFTGGRRPTKMDLDPTGSVQFGAPLLSGASVAVGGVKRTFNENEVTDAQALCYYANTDLFSGADLAARDALTRDLCPIEVTVSPGSLSIGAGGSATFTATVTGAESSAVIWSASSGSINQNGLFTAPQIGNSVVIIATSVADPDARGTATVSVGAVARAWQGTITVNASRDLSFMEDQSSPEDPSSMGSLNYGLRQSGSVTMTVRTAPVVVGTRTPLVVTAMSGSGTYSEVEVTNSSRLLLGGCRTEVNASRRTEAVLTGGMNPSPDIGTLTINADGSYRLTISGNTLAGPATVATVVMVTDQPANCSGQSEFVKSFASQASFQVGGTGDRPATGILNGTSIQGNDRIVTPGPMVRDGSGNSAVTITWDLRPI